jgi:hypothetical protein
MKGILWLTVPSALKDFAQIKPIYPNGNPHHITLVFGTEEHIFKNVIGKRVFVLAYENCWNDRIQAVRVQLPNDIPCVNRHPHITVSYAPGVEPKESNIMLASEHQSNKVSFSFYTIVEFYKWSP